MPRDLIHSPLHLLLSGWLLAACGGASEVGRGSASEESLGTLQAAVCSGASVTNLAIAGVSTYQYEMAASGSWAVAYPANAVRLDYYIDGALQSSDERRGTSGTWSFSQMGISCGAHTFLVKAIPMVIDSNDNRTTCWASTTRSASQSVPDGCPPTASLSCAFSSPVYNCTGSGSGGSAPLTPMWRASTLPNNSTTWQEGSWYDGSWSDYFYCKPWSYSTRVEFRVRDSRGQYSDIVTSICGNAVEYQPEVVRPWP
jgi:hypothetical protein